MGSSKKQTVGYKYFMGLHFALCYGPVDRLRRILVGDREAWTGEQTESGTISIDKGDLFGGKKKEGGVEGELDVMMGEPTQGANSYLASKITGLLPAFRGILSLVYKGGQIGANNPYVKPWAFEVERILEGWHGGDAWYPETAPILVWSDNGTDTEVLSAQGEWKYLQIAYNNGTDYSGPAFDDSAWAIGTAPFGSWEAGYEGDPSQFPPPPSFDPRFTATFGTSWTTNTRLWLRKTITLAGAPASALRMWCYIEDHCEVWVNGHSILATDADHNGGVGQYFEIADHYLVEGDNVLAIRCDDEAASAAVSVVYADFIFEADADTSANLYAMNPAHIIYQCLTDPVWGMGYPAAQIDEDSFAAAADTFHAEGMGLCLLWNQQADIESFVKTVLDHAGAVYYDDRKTGKFKLKPIRADYDPDTLPVYDESNIDALENFQRAGYGETVNEITVVYRDIITAKDSPITVQDLANIQAQGAVVNQTRQYPGLPTAELAARVAERDLIAASTPLAKCRITVNRNAWSTVTGDVIKVYWQKHGLSGVIFRVLDIDYGTLADGKITIELAEDVFGLPASSYAQQEPAEFEEPSNTPESITIQDVIETPYWDVARTLTASELAAVDGDAAFIMAVAASVNGLADGFTIYSRISPADYADSGSSGTFAPTAVTSAAIARTDSTIDYTDGISIDQVLVGERAVIGTGRDAEWVSVLGVDEGLQQISVMRGILDTTPQEFPAGTRMFFSESDYGVDPTERATGDAVDVKLTSFGGGGEASLAEAVEMSIEPDQRFYRPYAPGKVRINGEVLPEEIDGTIEVTWAHRDRLQQLVDYVSQDADSIGPELGTTYNAYLYDDSTNTLLESQAGIDGTSCAFTVNGQYPLRLEIEAERDGLASWQRQVRTFRVISSARLTEDDDTRVTEDGEGRDVEFFDAPPSSYLYTKTITFSGVFSADDVFVFYPYVGPMGRTIELSAAAMSSLDDLAAALGYALREAYGTLLAVSVSGSVVTLSSNQQIWIPTGALRTNTYLMYVSDKVWPPLGPTSSDFSSYRVDLYKQISPNNWVPAPSSGSEYARSGSGSINVFVFPNSREAEDDLDAGPGAGNGFWPVTLIWETTSASNQRLVQLSDLVSVINDDPAYATFRSLGFSAYLGSPDGQRNAVIIQNASGAYRLFQSTESNDAVITGTHSSFYSPAITQLDAGFPELPSGQQQQVYLPFFGVAAGQPAPPSEVEEGQIYRVWLDNVEYSYTIGPGETALADLYDGLKTVIEATGDYTVSLNATSIVIRHNDYNTPFAIRAFSSWGAVVEII